jgi:hypothetical protein
MRLWIDIFSVNQHRDTSNKEFCLVELKEIIESIGHTTVVIASTAEQSWKLLPPLHRTWCLWEIYCSLSPQRCITFCSSPKIARLCCLVWLELKEVNRRLESILNACEVSQCSLPTDKDRLLPMMLNDKEKFVDAMYTSVLAGLSSFMYTELAAWRTEELEASVLIGETTPFYEDLLSCFYNLGHHFVAMRVYSIALSLLNTYLYDVATTNSVHNSYERKLAKVREWKKLCETELKSAK